MFLSGAGLALAPMLAFAQANQPQCGTPGSDIGYIICKIGALLNTVIPILITLGVIYFIWGVISYVVAGDEEAKTAGRDKMIFGIIGLVVIIGMWGLVGIVSRTFGIGQGGGNNIIIPCVPYEGHSC